MKTCLVLPDDVVTILRAQAAEDSRGGNGPGGKQSISQQIAWLAREEQRRRDRNERKREKLG